MPKTEADAAMAEGEHHWLDGDVERARQSYHLARELYHAATDIVGEAMALAEIGDLEFQAGQLAEATAAFSQGLETISGAEDVDALVGTLKTRLAEACESHGEGDRARVLLDEAMAAFRSAGDLSGEANVLMRMSVIDMEGGHEDRAVGHLNRARALLYEAERGRGEADVLSALGRLYATLGHADQAHEALERAASLMAENGDLLGEASVRANLGRLLMRLGDISGARDQLDQAAHQFHRTGDQEGEARTLLSLARVESSLAGGDQARARSHHTRALELLDKAGLTDIKERAMAEFGPPVA